MFYWTQQVALDSGKVLGTNPLPYLTRRGAEWACRRHGHNLRYTKLVVARGWRCP